jgi:hypothetical protein
MTLIVLMSFLDDQVLWDVTLTRVDGNRNMSDTVYLKGIRILSPGMSSGQLNMGHHISVH